MMSSKNKTQAVKAETEAAKEPAQQDSNILEVTTEQIPTVEVSVMNVDNIPLKRGEVMFVEIDTEGNETNPATTSQKTWDKVFSQNPKFKLKKKL